MKQENLKLEIIGTMNPIRVLCEYPTNIKMPGRYCVIKSNGSFEVYDREFRTIVYRSYNLADSLLICESYNENI
jgi:hypothetical protein